MLFCWCFWDLSWEINGLSRMLLNYGALDYHPPFSRTPFWDVLCWMTFNITFPARPQERHLLSRPLCVVAHMHRDGLKLIFLLLPLDVTHNKGLRKAINPCDILVVTVHDFTNLICNSPTLFPLNLKQCYEFSPPQGEENPIHPLVFPDILP